MKTLFPTSFPPSFLPSLPLSYPPHFHRQLTLQPSLFELLSSSTRSSSTTGAVNATVSVFWDLDNKPPKLSPYDAALHLRDTASKFGDVVDMVAYANRHAFLHIPQWVRKERQERKELNQLERRGAVKLESPYVCSICGRKCKTNLDLKGHFKQLHQRERQKRMSRLQSLKGKRKAKFFESIETKENKYKDAARALFSPKVGYGLATELKRAGVFVQTVEDKPQAADRALKKRIVSSISRGINCICLVSDDTDFSALLTMAHAKRLRTVVIGDTKALQRFADVWLPWDSVAQGLSYDEFLEAANQLVAEKELMREISDDSSDIGISGFDRFGSLGPHPRCMREMIIRQEPCFPVINPEPLAKVSAFSEEEEYPYDSSEDANDVLGEL